MTDDDHKLAHKIANSWTNALHQECLGKFGENDGEAVFLSTICGAFAWTMTRLGADVAETTLNGMLRDSGLGGWRLIREN